MDGNWIEIKRGDVLAHSARLHVTLNPKGHIVMNRYTHLALGEPAAFSVLYDTKNNRIGLRPARKEAPNAYPVLRAHLNSAMVRADRLLREQRVVLPLTVQFDDAEVDENGILVLDLRTANPSRRAIAWGKRGKVRGER
ncbi:MAG: hypothetical protein AB7J13_04305 [Pyrinomonadaceae bacterium]